MLAEKKFIVSTDSLGVFGNPSDLKTIWGFLQNSTTFDGLELLGFESPFHKLLERAIEQIEENGFRVSGIHGRTGFYLKSPFDVLRLRHGTLGLFQSALLNNMLIETEKLMLHPAIADYVLFHESEVGSGDNHRIIIDNVDNSSIVFIENDYTTDPQAISRAIDRVKALTASGVRAKLMLDMYHAGMSPYYQSPLEVWTKANKALMGVRKNHDDLLGGVHIPLGLRPDDSLPFETVKGEYQLWRDFSDILNSDEGVKRRVLENQQSGLRKQIRPSGDSLNDQKKRNQLIYYDYLRRFGIA